MIGTMLGALAMSAWLAFGSSTAMSPPLLTYGVDVPLSTNTSHPGGLCVAWADGSRRMRLTPPHLIREPDWSPDGRQIAYARQSDIYVANAQGGAERNLTRGYANVSGEPAWSPDGRRVAFTGRGFQGMSSIGLVEQDGSGRRSLRLSAPGNPSAPSWAPSGRELAVIVVSIVPPTHDLHIAAIDGSNSRLLASGADEPDWSPDGSRIAFIRAGNLVIANVNDSATRTVAGGAASPTWSPDGRLIAFVRNGALLVVRPDGSGQRVVVRGPLPVHSPTWRPASSERGGTSRPCVQTGTSRADAIRGTSNDEIILAGRGADTVFAGGGNDIVVGGPGHDFLHGEAGNDHVVGSGGRDRIYGGRGDDSLYALDSESDVLDGGPGRDSASRDEALFGSARDRLRSIER